MQRPRMPFEAGTRLGPYEIIAPLGAGGMGEVYRGRDTRLDRTVAIKVLTRALAADAESRQRFEQEARAIAALNDPHICTIHDVGREGDLDYLVLEYMEGETLAERLRRSPGLPLGEALPIAIQIGEALDRAHGAGIVHRDLKPGNVMLVRRSGPSSAPDVKLLDFGLAARAAVERPKAMDASLVATMAPTMAAQGTPTMAATRPPSATVSSGFSGTVQYMAPEQLDGAPGDHRADIFAFGCVLYEMLAGRKAFEGGTVVTAIAAIMSSEPPPIASLQAQPFLDHVLRRCLEKNRERRWQSIRDVTTELRWIAAQPAAAAAAPEAGSSRARRMATTAGLTLAAAAVAAVAGYTLRGPGAAPDLPVLNLEISTAPTDDPTTALSPDGRRVAFIANQNRVAMLWVRSLDTSENHALPGTEGASFPFWSADGRSLGFFAENKLKRIDIDGGRPLDVADAPNGRGGTWNREGTILFSADVNGPIWRASTRGGPVEAVTEPGPRTGPDHRWPQFLPDGTRFLYSSTLGDPDTTGVYLASLDKTPPVRVLEGGIGRFAAPDKLILARQGALQAYDFDPASGAVQGEPVVIAQGIAGGAGSIATSDNGVLAYRAGVAQRRQLVWVDRKGTVLRAIGQPETGNNGSPELSRDDRSVVVFSQRGGENDIWLIELERNLARRITDGPPADAHPLWDPDGQHVVFFSARFGRRGPVRQSVMDGKAGSLLSTEERGVALSWARDRRYILLRREGEKTGVDLVAVSTLGEPREVAVTQTSGDETEGQFSPDGKWVAFVSNESDRSEVFVQSFPEARGRTQVSTAGGTQVRWSSDGKEIFYIAPDRKMMAASIAPGGEAPDVKPPVALFQTYLATGTNVIGNKPQYAVSSDGRFLLNTAVESVSSPIVVSVNWMKNLRR